MTSNTINKAYRSKIRETILLVLEETATAYAAQGDPDSDLRDAPEYLINVNLAQGLASTFPSLRYRLEHHASAYQEHSKQEIDAREAVGRATARFDIVLLNKSNNVPRYIIEVKRGVKIINDAKRIISMAALDSGRRRWRHGFLVTILRRTEQDVSEQMQRLKTEIESLRSAITSEIPADRTIKVTSLYRKIGLSKIDPRNKAIYGAVFHVTLLEPALASEADDLDLDAGDLGIA